MTVLTTERLTLEPLTVEHAAEMVDVLSAPSLYDVIGGTAPSYDELVVRYSRQVAGSGRPGELWLNWVIRYDGRAAGYVQATVTGGTSRRMASVAWLVRPEEQGRGIAREAAAAMLAFLRHDLGTATITANIADGHVASESVARRIGLAPTEQRQDGERIWSAPDIPTYRAFRWAAVVGYFLVIAIFTLLPRRGVSGPLDPQLVPVESLVDLVMHASRRTALTNIVGNLLLFAPLAVLLRLLITRSATRALLGVLLASVVVELLQGIGWTDGRQANIDDVILNVLGAAFALLLLRPRKI